MLIKCRLKRLITLDSNDYTVLFTEQIFINSFNETLGRVLILKHTAEPFQTLGRTFQILDRAFQTFHRAFEALRENQKLGREFEKLGQVFEKLGRVFKNLGRVFMLQHGPCCPNQPRIKTICRI